MFFLSVSAAIIRVNSNDVNQVDDVTDYLTVADQSEADKRALGYVRIGKREAAESEARDQQAEHRLARSVVELADGQQVEVDDGFVRPSRAAFMRFGRAYEDITSPAAYDGFMRFGRGNFMRFGRR